MSEMIEVNGASAVSSAVNMAKLMAPTAPDSLAQGRVRETLGCNDTQPCALKGRNNRVLSRPFRALFSPNPEFPGSRGLDPGLTNGTPLACNPKRHA